MQHFNKLSILDLRRISIHSHMAAALISPYNRLCICYEHRFLNDTILSCICVLQVVNSYVGLQGATIAVMTGIMWTPVEISHNTLHYNVTPAPP